MAIHEEKFNEDERRAHSDGRIGDVERPEVPAAPVDVYEVNHEPLP